LATPQARRQVNRKATLPATGRPANPRHAGVKIEAYHRREDGIRGYRPVGLRERSAQPRVAAPSRPERVQPRDLAVGSHYPVISRLRAIFPDLGNRKFPVSGAGYACLQLF